MKLNKLESICNTFVILASFVTREELELERMEKYPDSDNLYRASEVIEEMQFLDVGMFIKDIERYKSNLEVYEIIGDIKRCIVSITKKNLEILWIINSLFGFSFGEPPEIDADEYKNNNYKLIELNVNEYCNKWIKWLNSYDNIRKYLEKVNDNILSIYRNLESEDYTDEEMIILWEGIGENLVKVINLVNNLGNFFGIEFNLGEKANIVEGRISDLIKIHEGSDDEVNGRLMDEHMDPEDRDNPEMVDMFMRGEYL